MCNTNHLRDEQNFGTASTFLPLNYFNYTSNTFKKKKLKINCFSRGRVLKVLSML